MPRKEKYMVTDTIRVAISARRGVVNSQPSNQTNHKASAEKSWPAKKVSHTGLPTTEVNA